MKILRDFEYQRPRNLEDALVLLEKYGDKARPLAGGTDLIVGMKHRSILHTVKGAGTEQAVFASAARITPVIRPKMLISLADLPGLKGISKKADTVSVGPATTMSEFVRAADVPPAIAALVDAAGAMGSPLVRNRATIGGNVINARPAADTAVAILALDGRFDLECKAQKRTVKSSEFFISPGVSVRKPAELLVNIELPFGPQQGSAYKRHSTRRQLEIALVGVAAWVQLDSTSSNIADARISLGAVAPKPILASGAANALVGRQPTLEAFESAAKTARQEATPIDDFRGSAEYRLEIVEVLVRRALETAVLRARGAQS
ncbi:MAG: xanthine dehydrogenase family protein subunit M [Proteobacteria bacterium]|nr:xanthine dehydrogenase family protein subunit M [Pseudomonadota bacterium]